MSACRRPDIPCSSSRSSTTPSPTSSWLQSSRDPFLSLPSYSDIFVVFLIVRHSAKGKCFPSTVREQHRASRLCCALGSLRHPGLPIPTSCSLHIHHRNWIANTATWHSSSNKRVHIAPSRLSHYSNSNSTFSKSRPRDSTIIKMATNNMHNLVTLIKRYASALSSPQLQIAIQPTNSLYCLSPSWRIVSHVDSMGAAVRLRRGGPRPRATDAPGGSAGIEKDCE